MNVIMPDARVSTGTIDIGGRLREYRVGAEHLQTFLKDLEV